MRKETLQQYQTLALEIEDLTRRIEDLRQQIESLKRGQIGHTQLALFDLSDDIEAYQKALERETALLLKQKRKAQKLRYRIHTYIQAVPDSQMRLILKLRYIDGRTWLEISLRLGSVYESYSRMLHDRYLQ